MDKFRIDSHKLNYHIGRVNDWLNGRIVYPIYAEIAPSGACNQRCTYCALDFMGYRPRFLDTKIVKARISEMAQLGVKSIMFAGEGEPLLHKDIGDIIRHTKKAGIDIAVTTNGTLLENKLVDRIMRSVTWVKVSINAGTRKLYAKIHRSDEGDFDRVIYNMKYAAKARKAAGYKCALGMQMVLLPENFKEAITLAKIAKKIGMDYLVVKPYSQHLFSKTSRYKHIRYKKYLAIQDDLAGLNDKNFNVIFRVRTMRKWDEGRRPYRHCSALPFWTYIDAGGNVWGCSAYLGDNRFLYGNIYRNTFKEIWEGRRRRRLLKLEGAIDTKKCRVNCRMDEVNRYLWELKDPPEHINFI